MKINQELRPTIDKARQELKLPSTGQLRFGDMVQKQENKLQMEQLHKLMSQIESQGERLSRSRNFKDLAKYKGLVKNFVKQAVDFGMNLKQSHSWTSSGHSQTLKTVEQIDRSLVELTDEIVKKEQGTIDILGKIGEIKGLLINLYT
ncbi:YaaR family protein [Bacillus pinisoli]|uniref:YaaR family protein n=1 Tax=Bacillus pinisoli TaxID=2901866 RepID=UPI001FF55100|nr:YaaR family protein [Bacillus pinisoli]